MRFLVDESTGRRVAESLRSAGHDVAFVPDIMPGASDPEVLDAAFRDDRILVTNDLDFGSLVIRRRLRSRGVALLRLTRDRADNRRRTLEELIRRYGNRLTGSFTVVNEVAARIRPL